MTVSILNNEECRVLGAECRVQSAVCRVQSAVYRVQSSEWRVHGVECSVQKVGIAVSHRKSTQGEKRNIVQNKTKVTCADLLKFDCD